MEVWLLSRTLPTDADDVAGRFVIDQFQALSKLATVEVFHLVPLCVRVGAHRPQTLPPAVRLRYFVPPRGLGGNLLQAGRLIARMARKGRPSIMHAHWSSGLRGVVIAARLARVPVIFTEHGGPFPGRHEGIHDAKVSLNGANLVIAVSKWLRNVLVNEGVIVPIIVIPNIVDPVFSPSPLLATDRINVVTVARLDGFDKGIPEVIEACSLLEDYGMAVSLKVVGDGEDRKRLEALAAHGSGTVTFVGTMDRSGIAEILSDSHVLISATRDYETFGLAVAEAIAAGRPVVATRVGALPELVKSGVNGLIIERTDAKLIAEGILTVINVAWDPVQISATATDYEPQQVASEVLRVYQTQIG